jgi:hypothetical protein
MSNQQQETSKYSGADFTRNSAGLGDLAVKIQTGLFERFGVVSIPERAPHGVYGYAVLDSFGNILAADSPVFGQVVPICFKSRQNAERLATLHSGRAIYSATYGVDSGRYSGIARFGNRGPVTCRFPLADVQGEQAVTTGAGA